MGGKQKEPSILTKSIPFRKDFYKTIKEPKESPKEWLSRVNELAKLCDFGKSSDLFVLDKFVTGFETEIIDHLCSCAESLDFESSLDIIQAYNAPKTEITDNLYTDEQMVEFDGEEELIFSEDLVKYENDTTINSAHIKSDTVDDSSDDSSKDSEFLCSEYEKNIPKKKKRTKKTISGKKRKISTVKNDNSKCSQKKVIDPNAPKKKRKYKKRAVKEKQIIECETCHYKCYHECHMRRHKLIHLNQKGFICEVCGKAFNLFINLNAHIRRHLGYKPHICDICQTSFMDKTRLKLHMRTHTGERPYGCNVCDKKFADRYYLKVHMRLHTGEKPFECDQCHKTFSQSSSLSTHKKKNCLINPHILCKQSNIR